MFLCQYIGTNVEIDISLSNLGFVLCVHVQVCVCVCMCVHACMHACMCVCVCVSSTVVQMIAC